MKKNLFIVFLFLLQLSFGQTVTSVSPDTIASVNKEVTFTVTGSGLTANIAFYIDDLVNSVNIGGGNSNVQYFRGTFNQWPGVKNGVVKDQFNGNTLYAFDIETIAEPTINLLSPTNGSYVAGDGVVMNIDWQSTNQDHWEMNILKNGNIVGKEFSGNTTDNNTFFNWTIPSSVFYNGVTTVLDGSNFQIKIAIFNTDDSNTANVTGDTSGYITFSPPINNTPPVHQNSTISPQQAISGSNFTFNTTWLDNENDDIDAVEIRYKKNGGTWITIPSNDINYVNGTNPPRFSVIKNITGTTGNYTFEARARDENGAWSNWTFGANFEIIDNVTNTLTINPTSINQNSNSGSQNISVSSNISWTVSESLSWLSTSSSSGSNNGSFNLVFTENTSANSRNGIVTVQGSGITRQISVTQNGVSDVNPNPATFISVPTQLTINESYDLIVQSGTDPNGDLVRIKITATNSDLSPNPFLTSLQNGGQQITKAISFNQLGNQTVTIQTIDSNGNESSSENRTINIVDTSPINEVTIGNITFTANNIVELSTNKYELSGNVIGGDFIHFDGNVIVDINNLKVSGNGLIHLENIPQLGTVELYNGTFEYQVNSNILVSSIIDQSNELFELINLPVNINNITLLSDGINISGEINFPEVFNHVSTTINQIQITQSNGIQAVGNIHVDEIDVDNGSFKINNLDLSFDTINNKFSGDGSIQTNLINASANVEIIESGVDEISLHLDFNNPIALGTTGLQITGLSGGVANIQNPPMLMSIDVSLNPIGVPADIINFNNVGLDYEWGYSLTGHGGVTLLGQQAATASFNVSDGHFNVTTQINLFNILDSNFTVNLNKKTDGNLDVFARFDATVTVPAVNTGDGFPYDFIDSGINENLSLPLELANFDNVIHNRKLFGKGSLLNGDLVKFSYVYEYSNGQVIKNWAWNFSNFTNNFTNSSGRTQQLMFKMPNNNYTNKYSPEYSRFEGRSLIIKPNNYLSRRNSTNEIVQDFVLPSQMETIVVRVQPDTSGSLPSVTITNPNGDIINPTNFENYTGYIYSENSDTNGVYYTIVDAPMGSWSINITDNGQTNAVDIFGTKGLSGIVIDNINQNGSNIDINWTDFDQDFNGQIALYYSRDNDGLDGTMIANNISEDDETDSYVFDASNLDPGQYYIYAIMYDQDGIPISSYSQDFFTIGSNIQAPTNLTHTVNADDSVTFNWTKLDDTDNYDYILYYQADGDVNYSSLNINAGNTDTLNLPNLDQQPIYKFMVVAQDANNNLSEKSNIVTVDLAKTQTINLNAGWNLIGFNVTPFEENLKETFTPINNSLIQLNTQTEIFNPNLPDFLNTLTQLVPAQGYYANMSQSDQIILRGEKIDVSQVSFNLHLGWNLISYPAQNAEDITTALQNISPYIIQVNNQTQIYNPTLPDFLNTLNQLEPGKGYWIKVTQNCTLTF